MPLQTHLQKEPPHQFNEPVIVPWWKVLLLIALLIASIVVIFKFSIGFGAALLLTAVLFHSLGGFGVPELIRMESRIRIANFLISWGIVIALSIGLQYAFPQFIPLFSAFGGDLPLLTQLTMSAYPLLLLLPFFVGLIWMIWPLRHARLRVAAMFAWLYVGLILMVIGTLYLPIFKMGSVV